MNKTEALKLALVVEGFDNNDESLPLELLKPIAATLRALAQPEQGPVLTPKMREELNSRLSDHWYGCADEVWRIILAAGTAQPAAQYPTPPKEQQSCDKREWVGLTDKQRLEIADDSASYRMVLATEAKLKEMNT